MKEGHFFPNPFKVAPFMRKGIESPYTIPIELSPSSLNIRRIFEMFFRLVEEPVSQVVREYTEHGSVYVRRS